MTSRGARSSGRRRSRVWRRIRPAVRGALAREGRSAAADSNFRPDVQGLRAVAVLLVVLSHADVPHLAGGYIGVDVFFVISGFLITGWLLRHSERAGHVPFGQFYAARARRILPAAALTLIVTTIAASQLLNYVRAQAVFHDAIWSAFFAANVRFAHVGTNYLAIGAPPSPLQHFWSLAVEEQFYVVWPAILMVAVFLFQSRNRGRGVVDASALRRLGITLGVCVVTSLIWSIQNTSADPASAYFSTLTRAWELGVGALIAVGASQLERIPAQVRALMTWAGLAGVFVAAVAFNSQTAFPGYVALLPVLGAALIIIGGLGATHSAGAGVVLGRQPLRFIGDLSYSFYLWHWPVLILAMEHAGHTLSVATNLMLLVAAFALSVVTYFLYERPLRYNRYLSRRWYGLSLWPVSLILVLVVVARVTAASQPPAVFSTSPTPVTTTSIAGLRPVTTLGHPAGPQTTPYTSAVAASVTPARSSSPVPSGLTPPIANLQADFPNMSGCIAPWPNGTSSGICHMGDATATRTVVVFGDSHAEMWMPALTYFATSQGWDLIPLIKTGSCVSFAWSGNSPQNSVDPSCQPWLRWALEELKQLNPNAIVFATQYSAAGAAISGPAIFPKLISALKTAIDSLTALTPRLAFIEDVPQIDKDPIDCLLASGATLGSCTTPLRTGLTSLDSQVKQIVDAAQARFVPTLPWFCADNRCPTVIGNTIAYIEQGHVSKTYATKLGVPLAEALTSALG